MADTPPRIELDLSVVQAAVDEKVEQAARALLLNFVAWVCEDEGYEGDLRRACRIESRQQRIVDHYLQEVHRG